MSDLQNPTNPDYNPELDASHGMGQSSLGNQNSLKREPSSLQDDDDEEDKKGGRERRKIEIKFIQDKSRRHITFSKRKYGIMKKAYELSVLTGTQVLLLVVSETGLVYTFTTPKLQPLVTKPEGKNLIQSCLNAPDESDADTPGQDDKKDPQDGMPDGMPNPPRQAMVPNQQGPGVVPMPPQGIPMDAHHPGMMAMPEGVPQHAPQMVDDLRMRMARAQPPNGMADQYVGPEYPQYMPVSQQHRRFN